MIVLVYFGACWCVELLKSKLCRRRYTVTSEEELCYCMEMPCPCARVPVMTDPLLLPAPFI
jgi:hypothetical protein